jgi:hypothetical protein
MAARPSQEEAAMYVQSVRAPLSHPVAIDDLKPTQMTLGFREVDRRVDRLRRLAQEDGEKLLRKHVIPVVKGPKQRYHVIDHHHLCRALQLAGSEKVSVTVILNLERLEKDAFWTFLDNKGLVHPYDDGGKRRAYAEIPKSVKEMSDDPFRSLAGALRRIGGYSKDTTPFSEFLWADFLRRRFKREDALNQFETTLDAAFKLAKSKEADFLPGWCGPLESDEA